MTAEDTYINQVLDALPAATPRRQQIVLELRGHIAERIASGLALNDVLGQLGDPVTLAESYLSAVPLVSAPHGARLAAKIVDVVTILAVMVPIVLLPFFVDPSGLMPLVLFVLLLVFSLLAGLYLVVAEWRFGQTLGKYLFGLRVVRESGARISLGQSIVRQLPVFLNVFAIDALFVLFTEKRQRAFELLSKTRTVVAGPSSNA